MKMKKMKAAFAAMAIVALTFTACSGDDGDTGPAGATGNANVQSSTYTILASDWAAGSATIDVPELTEDIANNGVVTAFFTTDSLGTDTIGWNPLPYSVSAGGTNYVTTNYRYRTGEVDLTLMINNVSAAGYNIETYAKIILIPSSSLVEGVDINNYEEVKMVYGIEEYGVK